MLKVSHVKMINTAFYMVWHNFRIVQIVKVSQFCDMAQVVLSALLTAATTVGAVVPVGLALSVTLLVASGALLT